MQSDPLFDADADRCDLGRFRPHHPHARFSMNPYAGNPPVLQDTHDDLFKPLHQLLRAGSMVRQL